MIPRLYSGPCATVHRHALRELHGVSDAPGSVSSEFAGDIATAVVQYIADHASATDMRSRHLRALIARALAGCGDADSGSRLLLEQGRVARRSRWTVVGDAPVVALDLARLCEGDGTGMELIVQHAIGRVLHSLENTWDVSGGCGFLGLRNVRLVASRMLGRPLSHRKTRALAREFADYCDAVLSAAAARRAWEQVPGILDMDWKGCK